MPIVSTGQITIVDYNDAISLTSFIGSNQALTQIYNPDNAAYTPSYATSNLILTPSLFVSGSANDVIATANVKAIKWFDSIAATTEIVANTNYGLPAFASGTNRPLTIKANILNGSVTAKTFICEITYTDPATGLDLVAKSSISISRINNGGGVTIAQATTPSGNVFKNGNGSNLTAVAELLRASGVDTSSVTYQWYKQNSAVVTDEGAGVGWDKLDATTNFGTTGYTTNTLTIPAGAVTGVTSFKVAIKDTDSASPTYNQTFFATVTISDQTDPIQLTVHSTGGDVLKNGVGSTTLTAKLFQASQEVDTAGTKYTYKWYKYNSAGTLDANFGGTGISFKTGKTLAVGSTDVDVKATFVCEIE